MENLQDVNFGNLPVMVANLFDRLDLLEALIKNIPTEEKQKKSERLTRKQLKEEYQIGYATIHSLMRKELLPFDKVGRKTLFKRVDVENCISNRKG
jgi:hypothetical protein